MMPNYRKLTSEESKANMKIDKSKFVADYNNARIIASLFKETAQCNARENAVYTFKSADFEWRGKLLISIHKRFMEHEGSEYDFALEYFLDWQHWDSVCTSPRCKPFVDQMRAEYIIKARADAVRLLIDKSKTEVNAAKYVAEVGWEKRPPGVRKNKEEKKADADLMKAVEKDIANANLSIN